MDLLQSLESRLHVSRRLQCSESRRHFPHVRGPKVKGEFFASSGPPYTDTKAMNLSPLFTSRQSTSNVYVSSFGASNQATGATFLPDVQILEAPLPVKSMCRRSRGHRCFWALAHRSEARSDQPWNVLTKGKTCDKGLCRDLRNPVGNGSIAPHVCEYMAPAPVVFATPVPVVEYIALVSIVSYAAQLVEYTALALAVIATPTPLSKYIAPASAVSYVASLTAGCAAPALVVEYIAPARAVIAKPAPMVGYIAPAPTVSVVAPTPDVYTVQAPVVITLRQHMS